jgi:hypothetical protein
MAVVQQAVGQFDAPAMQRRITDPALHGSASPIRFPFEDFGQRKPLERTGNNWKQVILGCLWHGSVHASV